MSATGDEEWADECALCGKAIPADDAGFCPVCEQTYCADCGGYLREAHLYTCARCAEEPTGEGRA